MCKKHKDSYIYDHGVAMERRRLINSPWPLKEENDVAAQARVKDNGTVGPAEKWPRDIAGSAPHPSSHDDADHSDTAHVLTVDTTLEIVDLEDANIMAALTGAPVKSIRDALEVNNAVAAALTRVSEGREDGSLDALAVIGGIGMVLSRLVKSLPKPGRRAVVANFVGTLVATTAGK